MQDELSRMFGRVVDLHTPASLSRYFRDEVVAAAQDQLSRHDPSVSLRHMRDHAYELAALVRGRSHGDLDSGPPASKQGREHEGAPTPRVTHARPARGSRRARRQFETGQPDPSIHRPRHTTRRPSTHSRTWSALTRTVNRRPAHRETIPTAMRRRYWLARAGSCAPPQ